MKHVYDAANSLEAHMILDLLRQEGIRGQVEGEYLQGAVGALPAAGLVRVVVDEADHAAAQRVITRWNQAQPDEPALTGRAAAPKAAARGLAGGWLFLAGVVLGVGFCQVYLHPAPADAAVPACKPA
ncbi:putative signal transducing protein [Ramlibacter tataouinensis]|uniref:DUF2007 domain-containing protein n=1 Tax=Ramlibacter tataouinensis (strain ATCC BAA-407 / DSM 14655 / LMG 21543 / TTB310) TaxID=365046 RepID=F5Y6B2_RAMTT|nr:DUF2007 domain-containing protein [Ramlibacter tataouinensis]AEG92798.1 hypothetical protein Rta_17080 [Ramlibacter tataouinensis TTB310]